MSMLIKGKYYYLYLLVACLVGFAGVFSCHLIAGKSFIWASDGIPLYLNFLIYEGELIRSLASGLISGSFEGFPLYSFSLGYGSDAVTPMAGCINDPLNLLSAFCPPEYAEFLYAGLIFARVYLCASAFSFYALGRGNGRAASFCGALCYAFSGYAIIWAMLRHPSFLTVMYLFPIVLAGADKIFKGKSPVLLIVSAALSFFTSLYFSYMLVLLLVIYCAVQYFTSSREKGVKDFACVVLTFVGCLIVSFLLAAIMALPVMLVLLSLGRVGTETWVPLLQSTKYYLGLFSSLLGGTTRVQGLTIGAASLFCLILYLACGKRFEDGERKPILVLLGVCLLFVLVPFFGHALNGFSYVSDRWMFGLCFCVSYVVCKTIPMLGGMTKRDWLKAMGVCALISVPIVLLDSSGSLLCRMVMLLVFVATILALYVVSSKFAMLIQAGVLSVLVVIGAGTFSALHCATGEEPAIKDFVDRGAPWGKIEYGNPYASAESMVEDDFRVSSYGRYVYRNAPLLAGVKGIDFFSSFYIQLVDDFRRENGLSDHYSNYVYAGSDSRYALDAVSGARYFIAKESSSWRIPYGYERVADLGNDYCLYETADALPMVFVYDSWIPVDVYQGLDMTQKQEALLQGCVVEGSSVERVDSVETTSYVLDSQVIYTEGLTVEDGVIRVDTENARMVLSVEGCRNSEMYVRIEGLNCRGLASENYGDSFLEGVKRDLFLREKSSFDIDIFTSDSRKRSIQSVSSKHTAYGGKQDWVVNLGYYEEGCGEVVVEFQDEGIYSLEQLSIVAQPVAPLVEDVKRLNAGSAVDYSFDVNQVTASADLDGAGLVYFSIPYSSGWTATVNGEPAEILAANTAFMAIEISDAGSYEICLHYETPGLKLGAALSMLGLVLLVVIVVSYNRRNKTQVAL